MSVQFGKWSFDGAPATPEYLAKVRKILSPYGPDGETSHSGGGVDVLYYALHTTKESRLENQPHLSASGAVVTWDGRLDNRAELIGLLDGGLSAGSTDVSIVAAAYQQWGTRCFGRLIGDWAVSIWNPSERSLVLAKDLVGTRHLHYTVEKDKVTWCTILDPLVLFAERTFDLEEEYIAGWLSFFPSAHLTPYVGIDSVPPSCFVRLERGRQAVSKYWDFDPTKKICYCADAEYEEHFRTLFAEAVRRRLRSDTPVLAELSGGMDSSSIVCVADTIIARGMAETPRLDTLSYYDDSEPNWNERPYFTKVEEKRGRTGCHIDVSTQEPFSFGFESNTFVATPGSGGRGTESSRQFAACMASHGNRVVLSGVGGDEITGGVPTPIPELMDLLARARFRALARQLKVWALNKRKPWFHLLFAAAQGFFPPFFVCAPQQIRAAAWLQSSFVKRQHTALTGYPSRVTLFGPLPSLQENVSTLDALRRQLACSVLPAKPPYEKRYPYLDRDLLEFIYAIPRQQVVRPGQRRSLVRRALAGTVPDELLNRKRKAFVVRGPMKAVSADWPRLTELGEHLVSSSLEIVEPRSYLETLRRAHEGQEVPMVPVLRTLSVEFWLRNSSGWGVLKGGSSMPVQSELLRSRAELAQSFSQES